MALYRINEQDWETSVKQKTQQQYHQVKKRLEQDVGQLARFFGGKEEQSFSKKRPAKK